MLLLLVVPAAVVVAIDGAFVHARLWLWRQSWHQLPVTLKLAVAQFVSYVRHLFSAFHFPVEFFLPFLAVVAVLRRIVLLVIPMEGSVS